MHSDAVSVESLTGAAWDAIGKRCDRLTGRVVADPSPVPGDPTEPAGAVFGDAFPVLEHLPVALDEARKGPLGALVKQLESCLDTLRWSQNASYVAGKAPADLLSSYAYLPLSSPHGPLRLDVPRAGFILLGPDMEYADHHHAPREAYLLLTGGTRWRVDKGDWFDTQAGDLILHNAWQYHAMQTGEQPMLAFVGWLDSGSPRDIRF